MKRVEIAVHMGLIVSPDYIEHVMQLRERAAIDVLDQYRAKIAARDKLIAEDAASRRPRFGLRRVPTPARRREAAALVAHLEEVVEAHWDPSGALVEEAQTAEPPQAAAFGEGLSHPSIAALLSEPDAAQD